MLKNQLVEYYIGDLAPRKDFLDSIDEEIKLSEKRKNCEIEPEIKTKIRKLSSPVKSHNSKVEDICSEGNSTQSPVKYENNLKLLEQPNVINSVPNNMSLFENSLVLDEDTGKPGFMDSSSDINESVEITNHEEINIKQLGEVCSNNKCSIENQRTIDNYQPREQESNGNSDADTPDIDNITLSQWSRGDIKINGETIKVSL